MIKFEIVSRLQGKEDIKLPQRATAGSAGYDFYYNDDESTIIQSNEIIIVKTGIKAKMPRNVSLEILNRSSNPIKKGLEMANGIGLVDSDYYNNSDNEGEIGFEFRNTNTYPVTINKGDKLGQGVFRAFYKTDDDETDVIRNGGFGSTGK